MNSLILKKTKNIRKSNSVKWLFAFYPFLFSSLGFAEESKPSTGITKIQAELKSQKNEEIPPGQFPKTTKPYVNSDNVIFWPMSLPFWIRLATSLDPSAETFTLTKIHDDSQKSHESQDLDKAIELEIPGNQFVRWMHYYSKKEVLYRFVADAGPPSVQHSFTNALQAPTQAGLSFGKGLAVDLSANDAHSGVNYLAYSINNGPYVRYDKPIPFSENGTYTLQYYAIDNVRYASKVETVQFKVDVLPPTTSHSRRTGVESKVLGPRDQVVLSATDGVSGVKSTHYKTGKDTGYSVYTAPISLKDLPEGNQIISYFSKDQLENQETAHTAEFYLCRTAPDVLHSFKGDLYVDGASTFISPRTFVELHANEVHSKAKEITYKVSGVESNSYKTPFKLKASLDPQTVSYQVRDEFENISPNKETKVIVDAQPPKTSPKFEGPVYIQSADTIFMAETGKMTLPATDKGAGVLNTYLKVGEGETAVFKGFYSSAVEASNRMRFFSVDKVNNREDSQAILVVVDKTPPDILVAFSNDPLRIEENKDRPEKTFNVGTSILVSAVDKLSGVNDIKISIDNGPLQKYESPIPFKEQRLYTATIVASDRVGNLNRKNVRFYIKEHVNQFEVLGN